MLLGYGGHNSPGLAPKKTKKGEKSHVTLGNRRSDPLPEVKIKGTKPSIKRGERVIGDEAERQRRPVICWSAGFHLNNS